MARTQTAVKQQDAEQRLNVFVPFAFVVTTIIGWNASASAQDLQLSPAPLVIDGGQYEAPQKLNITDVSSIIPSPEPTFFLPTTKSPFASPTPLLPSIAGEFSRHQAPQQDLELNTPVQETEQDRGLLEEEQPPANTQDLKTGETDEAKQQAKDPLDDLMGDNNDLYAEDTDVQTSPRQVWKLKSIHQITFQHHSGGEVPSDRSAELLASAAGLHSNTVINDTVYWVAPNIYYQPLLFEDALLERYGRSSQVWGVQPWKSGAHFAIDSFLMPFRAYKYRCEVETPLAFQRPGSCNEPTRNVILPRN